METASADGDAAHGTIVIDNTDSYTVGRARGSLVHIKFDVNDWRIKKRNKDESDASMQARIQEAVDTWRQQQCSSPASTRPTSSSRSLEPEASEPDLAPPSPETAAAMMMPPPPKRPNRREGEGLCDHGPDSTSSQPHEPAAVPAPHSIMRSMAKKLREITVLQAASTSRPLNAEELAKVALQPGLESQLRLMRRSQPPPVVTPVSTPSARVGTPLSSAPTRPAAACAAAACNAAHDTLSRLSASPATRPSTRATAEAVRQQMASKREELERARIAALDAARAAEAELWAIVRAPLDSWDDEAVWQLAMCEYALEHLHDVAWTPKQLQVDFRAECQMARHPEVHRPRSS
jgi:hypothetical protein